MLRLQRTLCAVTSCRVLCAMLTHRPARMRSLTEVAKGFQSAMTDANNAEHNLIYAVPMSQNENQALRQRAADAEQTNGRLLQVFKHCYNPCSP